MPPRTAKKARPGTKAPSDHRAKPANNARPGRGSRGVKARHHDPATAHAPPHPRRAPRPGAPAQVLLPPQHPLKPSQLHPNVLFACQRLRDLGYQAVVVGGAVRDMLLGRAPKDYDLATSAWPEKAHRAFRNARIIGRRFRLVELRFPDMAIEISTFRAKPTRQKQGMIVRDNSYGSLAEDMRRRDFTINGLAYDPISGELLDYVGGLEDLAQRQVRTIIPPQESFQEDPVRMLRAVRFSVRLGLEMEAKMESLIPGMAPLLERVKRPRLLEEMQRFLTRGNAVPMFHRFDELGLLPHLLGLRALRGEGNGVAGSIIAGARVKAPLKTLTPLMDVMDGWHGEGATNVPATVAQLAVLIAFGTPGLQNLFGPEAAETARDLKQLWRGQKERMAGVLDAWGMLRGQTGPALLILERASRWAFQHLHAEGGDQVEGSALAPQWDYRAGDAEALLLLRLCAPMLGHDVQLPHQALLAMEEFPPFPIMDHPPLRRLG